MANIKNAIKKVEVRHYAVYHKCGQELAGIDHLLPQTYKDGKYEISNWDHKPNHPCRAKTSFTIYHDGGDDYYIEYRPGTGLRTWEPCTVLMELPPQEKSVFLVVKTNCHLDDETPSSYPNSDYYYNESTCPTNWIREVKEIHYDGDSDPHGLFRYVRTTRPPQPGEDEKEGWANELFPEILQGVTRDEYGDIVCAYPFLTSTQHSDVVDTETVVAEKWGEIASDQDTAKMVCFNESLLSIDPASWPSDIIAHSRESLLDYIKMLGLKYDIKDSDVAIKNITDAGFLYKYAIYVKKLLWGFSNKPFQSTTTEGIKSPIVTINKPECTFRILDRDAVLAGTSSNTYEALVDAINDIAPWLQVKLEDLQLVETDRLHLKYDILLEGHKVGDADGPFVKHSEL